MELETQKKKLYFFILISYLWTIGSFLAVATTEDSKLCINLENVFVNVVLYGNAIYFIFGGLYSLQKKCVFYCLLKFYNISFQFFCLFLCVFGFVRFLLAIKKTCLCTNIFFFNNFFTLVYGIIFGTFLFVILIFCLLEFIVQLYYFVKMFLFCAFNCCCCSIAWCFPGTGGKNTNFDKKQWKIHFLQYILLLFQMLRNDGNAKGVAVSNTINNSNIGLTEAEQKKIILAL